MAVERDEALRALVALQGLRDEADYMEAALVRLLMGEPHPWHYGIASALQQPAERWRIRTALDLEWRSESVWSVLGTREQNEEDNRP